MNDTQRRIEQALSLRDPQKESLGILAQILEKIDLSKDTCVEETLRLIQEIRPSVKDFERIFPCICFRYQRFHLLYQRFCLRLKSFLSQR